MPNAARSTRICVASVGGEVSRISNWFPYHRVICDNYRRARLEFISELVSEVGTKPQPGRQSISIDGATFAGHPHPSRLLVIGRESAGFSRRSFQHSEHMVSKLVAPT